MHNDIKEILFTTEQIEAKAAELAKKEKEAEDDG